MYFAWIASLSFFKKSFDFFNSSTSFVKSENCFSVTIDSITFFASLSFSTVAVASESSSSTTSSSYRAYVGGALYAEGDIVAYSDVRKKTDIVTIDNALHKVINLRGVYYTRIDDPLRGRQTGVIAQEINEVLPEVVTYAADVDHYGVSYGNIVGVLIEAIKELSNEVKELKKQINKK